MPGTSVRVPLSLTVVGVSLAVVASLPGTAPQLVPAASAASAAEPVSSGDRAIFEPVAPVRLLDTRSSTQGPALAAGSVRELVVAGAQGVPPEALAVVVNVTAVWPSKSGYLTVWPSGEERPTASNVNFLPGQVVPNLATVKIGSGGKISIFNSAAGTTHVVVDLAGYYRAHAHDDRYPLRSEVQGRTAVGALTCAGGTLLQAVAPDGAATCVTDKDTTYSAGSGLSLSNGVFSAQQTRSAAGAFTCPTGQALQAIAADGAPTCLAVPPPFVVGTGLTLQEGVLSAEQGRSAANAFTCTAGSYLRSVAANGAPTCAADANTTYSAGFGLNLTGTTFAAQQGRSAFSAFTCPTGQALRSVASDGAPTCAAVSAYTAGPGLELSGTELSAAHGPTVVPLRGDRTPAENGTALRSAMNAISDATSAKPYVLSLAPGTYDLGSSALTLRADVSVIGAGRGLTQVTGSVLSQAGGLVNLNRNTTLARLSVRNTTSSTTNWATGVWLTGGNGRVVEVESQASGAAENYGLLVFSSGQVLTERSSFVGSSGSGTGTGVGIYAITGAVVRAHGVLAASSAPTGYAVHAHNASDIELTESHADGAVRKGTPDSAVKLAFSRVDGATSGGVRCFQVHNSAWDPVTCA